MHSYRMREIHVFVSLRYNIAFSHGAVRATWKKLNCALKNDARFQEKASMSLLENLEH